MEKGLPRSDLPREAHYETRPDQKLLKMRPVQSSQSYCETLGCRQLIGDHANQTEWREKHRQPDCPMVGTSPPAKPLAQEWENSTQVVSCSRLMANKATARVPQIWNTFETAGGWKDPTLSLSPGPDDRVDLLPHSEDLGCNKPPGSRNWTLPMLTLVWQVGKGRTILSYLSCSCMPPLRWCGSSAPRCNLLVCHRRHEVIEQ